MVGFKTYIVTVVLPHRKFLPTALDSNYLDQVKKHRIHVKQNFLILNLKLAKHTSKPTTKSLPNQ